MKFPYKSSLCPTQRRSRKNLKKTLHSLGGNLFKPVTRAPEVLLKMNNFFKKSSVNYSEMPNPSPNNRTVAVEGYWLCCKPPPGAVNESPVSTHALVLGNKVFWGLENRLIS